MKLDLLCLAVGAVLGAFLRYKITSESLFISSLPVSVLVVNVLGSFILGMAVAVIAILGLDSHYTLLVGIGFCGALTTMSSFAYETMGLFDLGRVMLAVLNIFLNIGFSILAVYAGRALALVILGVR